MGIFTRLADEQITDVSAGNDGVEVGADSTRSFSITFVVLAVTVDSLPIFAGFNIERKGDDGDCEDCEVTFRFVNGKSEFKNTRELR